MLMEKDVDKINNDKNDNFEIKIVGDTKNLLEALLKITKNVENVPKNGKVSYGTTRYTYVLEKDVVNMMRELLMDEGIILIPNMIDSSERLVLSKDGKSVTVAKVCMSYTFLDSKTGGYITTYFYGEGSDSLDKGIYKAITGCQKYFLLKTFLVPTGDDPELQEEEEETRDSVSNKKARPDEKISPDKAKMLFAVAKGNEVLLKEVLGKYNYKNTYDITYRNFSSIFNELKSSNSRSK